MSDDFVEANVFQQAMLKAQVLREMACNAKTAEKAMKDRFGFSLIKQEGILAEHDKVDITNEVLNMLARYPAMVATDHLKGYFTPEQYALDHKRTYPLQVAAMLDLQSDKDLEVAECAKRKHYTQAINLKRAKLDDLEAVAAATAMNGPVKPRELLSSAIEDITLKMLPTRTVMRNNKQEYEPTDTYSQLARQYVEWLSKVRSFIAARSREGLIEHSEVYRETDRLMAEFSDLANLPSIIMSTDMLTMLTGNTLHVLPNNEAVGVLNTSSMYVAMRANGGTVAATLPLINRGGKVNHLEASRKCEVGNRYLYKEMITSPTLFNQNIVTPKVLMVECTPLPSITQLMERMKAVWTVVLGGRHADILSQQLVDTLRPAQLDQVWYSVAFKHVPISTTHKDFVRVQCKDVQLEIMASKEAFSHIQNSVAKVTPIHQEPAHGYSHVFYAPSAEDVPQCLYLTGEKPIAVHRGGGMHNTHGIYCTHPVLTRLHEWPARKEDWRSIGLYGSLNEAEAAIYARDQYAKRMQEAEAAAAKLEKEQELLRQQLKDKEAALELERKKHEDTHRLQQQKHEEELALKAETLRVNKEQGIRDANLREAKQEAEILDTRFQGYLALEELKQKSRDALYKGLEIVGKSSGGTGASAGLLGALSGLANTGQGVGLSTAFNAVNAYAENLSAEERHAFVQAMYDTEVSNFKQLGNWMNDKYEKLERQRVNEAKKDKERITNTVDSTASSDPKVEVVTQHVPSTQTYPSYGNSGHVASSGPAYVSPPTYKPTKAKKFIKAAAVGVIAVAGGMFFGLGTLVALGAGLLMGGIAAF